MRIEKPEIVQHYVELLVLLLRDTAKLLGLKETSISKDIKSIERGVNTYGIEYITVHLPKLAKALDCALANDKSLVIPEPFKGQEYGFTRIPVFLGFLWKLIFRVDGQIKQHDCDEGCDKRILRDLQSPLFENHTSRFQIIAVRAIRQIGYLGYKLEYRYTKEQEQARINEFESIEAILPKEDDCLQLSSKTRLALENANALISFVLRRLNIAEITPRHGPGSVATGEPNHKKYHFKRFYGKIDEVYPYSEYFFFSPTHLCDELEHLESLIPTEQAIAKVVLVPKDSRGPRLISMEPLEIQWIQQGLARSIIREIEDERSITYGYVNFHDQDVNRLLALYASNGESDFVTLDLKDASDRVSAWLVKKLFPQHIAKALFACRSDFTMLPDGRCLRLKKFAPMGSACCFPVEALIFWALAVGSLVRITGPNTLRNAAKKALVAVYGDDMVVRRDDYDTFRSVFEELNLRFNEDKCCLGRYFRESCGVDAFKTKDITPTKLHALWPKRWSPKALLSYCAYANALREEGKGYDSVANYIQDCIQQQIGPLPVVNVDSSIALAIRKPSCSREETLESLKTYKRRWNKRLHRYEWKIRVPYARTFEYELRSDWDKMWSINSLRYEPFGKDNSVLPGEFTYPKRVSFRWSWVTDDQLARELSV